MVITSAVSSVFCCFLPRYKLLPVPTSFKREPWKLCMMQQSLTAIRQGGQLKKEAAAIRGELQTIVPQSNCKPALVN